MTKAKLIEENNRLKTEVAYLKGLLEPSNKEIKFGTKKFKYASEMIKAAISEGYTHKAGNSLVCKNCGRKTVREFHKNEETVYCCHKCLAVY